MRKKILSKAVLSLAVAALFANMISCSSSASDSGKPVTKDAIETIMQRTSVRQFKNKPVEEEKIDILLRAAMAAPSGMDRRPWQFVVVQDKEKLKTMGEALPYAKMLKDIDQAIVVCGDSAISKYWYLDCSTATQNILLAAQAIDLGAVWTAAYPYQDRMDIVRKNLNIPDSIQPLCVIPFGYPKTEQQPKDKYNPKVIHRNSYQ